MSFCLAQPRLAIQPNLKLYLLFMQLETFSLYHSRLAVVSSPMKLSASSAEGQRAPDTPAEQHGM
ncbi:MAG TPA: hypothetical protein VKU02_04760 [Gemmataceae bacterium]|nr:hypothetical protein [Gemmataceae bacterium]